MLGKQPAALTLPLDPMALKVDTDAFVKDIL